MYLLFFLHFCSLLRIGSKSRSPILFWNFGGIRSVRMASNFSLVALNGDLPPKKKIDGEISKAANPVFLEMGSQV